MTHAQFTVLNCDPDVGARSLKCYPVAGAVCVVIRYNRTACVECLTRTLADFPDADGFPDPVQYAAWQEEHTRRGEHSAETRSWAEMLFLSPDDARELAAKITAFALQAEEEKREVDERAKATLEAALETAKRQAQPD